MEHVQQDVGITLAALDRLEAERKLAAIPASVLESAWAREAQAEAVSHAVLAALCAGDDRAYAHARHAGEWAARIGAELACELPPALMRRCAALSGARPDVLERIPELRECAPAVRAFQGRSENLASRIIEVALAFDSLVFEAGEDRRIPSDALRMLRRSAREDLAPVVEALFRSCRKQARAAAVNG